MANRQQLALATKHKIVTVARQLIAEKGINNISVQDITDKAGVAKGSFYTYFDKKEDILNELVYQNFSALKDKYLQCESIKAEQVLQYLLNFTMMIYEGGLELCKSWTSSELLGKNGSICKFDLDCSHLKEILIVTNIEDAEQKAYNIMAYLYGMMTVWCMTDGRCDFLQNFKNNFEILTKILEG